MDFLTGTLARILYGVPFGIFGLFHLLTGPNMAMLVPTWVPGGVFWVYLTGIFLIAASVAIITGKLGAIACKLLALLLFIFILTVHVPGLTSEATMQMSMTNLLKDLALIGAALTYSRLYEKGLI